MSTGFPDWTRAIVLLGWDGASFIPVLLDTDGNLNVLMRGEDGLGALHTVAVDVDGQIIMVPRGSTGNYMNVDASGFLTTILKGIDGATLRTLAVDGSGNLIALVKGTDGVALRTLATDAAGQMIMVPRGNTGNYMAVDASGFLTTVLKGTYGAELKTVAVDADGKLNAFIYDTVDAWGQVSTVGLSELAARMGSPLRYERSGQLYFADSFEYGLQRWVRTLAGLGAAVAIDPATFCTGGYSCKLTGGSNGGHYVALISHHGTLPVGRMGIQCAFAPTGVFGEFWLDTTYWAGATWYRMAVGLNDATGQIHIVAYPGGDTVVGTYVLQTRGMSVFNSLKIVGDLSAERFVQLRLNNQTIDLSAYRMTAQGGVWPPGIDAFVTMYSRNGFNDVMYIDDYVLTFAEP